MLKNIAIFLGSLSFASLILIVSIFRIAQIKYVFSQSPTPTSPPESVSVDYQLPYPGKIAPDNFLWPLKVIRDKVWLTVTLNPAKKADLYLLFADKRLVSARDLFAEDKADLAVSVLTKGEKYLELAQQEERVARSQGMDTTNFLERYSLATLKHREIIDEILTLAPEDAKPIIVSTQDYSKSLYDKARDGLLQAGATVPLNPFD
jgi:hypothetical protein